MSARRSLGLGALLACLACGGEEPPATPASPAKTAAPAPAAAASETAAPTAAEAAADASTAAPASTTATPGAATLTPEQVATIDGELALTWADLDRYLGTVYARLPEGVDALQQLVAEAVIDAAAKEAGVTASDADVAALEARLEAQAREASGGAKGLQESLGASVTPADLRAALRLQVLHERIVRHDQGQAADAPVDPALLKSWLDAHVPAADALVEPPLTDALAATWPDGEVSKAQVGRRLRALLPPKEVSGVLTEMIGVLLVRREAARLGLQLTPAEATREVLERDATLKSKAGAGDVTYDQFVQTVQKRSLKELLESDQFGTEVLLRLIAERSWTEDSARAEWEAHPERFPPPAAPQVQLTGAAPATPAAPEPRDWEHMRSTVWRALRQESYAQLFKQSRIVRRF